MTEGTFKSGFVSVIGKPNVGKSTLINRLMKQKIAAVSPRPQTTRRNQLGIITTETSQIVFIDTPGMHKPLSKLGQAMNDAAVETLKDADLFLWLVDASEEPDGLDQSIASRLKRMNLADSVIIVLNKIDLVKESNRSARAEVFQQLLPGAQTIFLSAHTGMNTDKLLTEISNRLPDGPAFYDHDQITDLYEREIAADLIRESLMQNIDDEIPHSCAVRIEEFKDRADDMAYILATILVDRETHKGIIVGKKGEMIKKIGTYARKEIENMTGKKVYLELKVKTMSNWRNNSALLRDLGYEH